MLRITHFIIIMISLLTILISTCFGRYGNYVGVLLHKDNIQWSQGCTIMDWTVPKFRGHLNGLATDLKNVNNNNNKKKY